jgi:hypothetical protein
MLLREDNVSWIYVGHQRQRVISEYKRDTIPWQTRIKEIGKGVELRSRTIITFSRLHAPFTGTVTTRPVFTHGCIV